MNSKSNFSYNSNTFQTFVLENEETVQKGFIINNEFHPKIYEDDDFDDGPLRIVEIENDEDDTIDCTPHAVPVEDTQSKNEEFNTWAQDILEMMDSSIAQLDALKIKKNEFALQDEDKDVTNEGKLQLMRPKSLELNLDSNLKVFPNQVGSEEGNKDVSSVEEETDVDVLYEMLNTVFDYDTRRRIRKRIKELNKNGAEEKTLLEDVESRNSEVPSPVKSVDEGYVSVSSPISPPIERRRDDFTKEFPIIKMGDYADGINLDEIDDELELHNLLDNSDDIEERKMIRNRLREVMAAHRAEREEMIRKREEDRENILRKRVADSDEHKRRTLAMYDAMAKSAPAGGNKNIDVSILRTGIASAQPVVAHQKLDLVEEAIKDRQKSSDDQKKRTLIAFDKAARSAPAGMARIVDFDCVNKEDMCKTDKPPNYSSCFEMRGGVPSAAKVVVPKPMQYTGEPERDLMEEAIRKRQTEADDRKRRTLAAYDQAARSRPAGQPVSVYIPTTDGIDPVVTVCK